MGETNDAEELNRLKALAEVLRLKAIKEQVLPAARKLGVREDALDLVQARAEAVFELTASGSLRGPDGLTAPGWCRFKLVAESPYLLEPTESETAPDAEKGHGPSPSDRPETARERLSRANGEVPALEAVRWGGGATMIAAPVGEMRSAPPELWSYSDFESLIPNTSPRNLVRLADRKKFPPFIRMTPRGEPMWAKAAILRYVARVYRPLIDSLSADSELSELGQEG